jgi:hypothetical protein
LTIAGRGFGNAALVVSANLSGLLDTSGTVLGF